MFGLLFVFCLICGVLLFSCCFAVVCLLLLLLVGCDCFVFVVYFVYGCFACSCLVVCLLVLFYLCGYIVSLLFTWLLVNLL